MKCFSLKVGICSTCFFLGLAFVSSSVWAQEKEDEARATALTAHLVLKVIQPRTVTTETVEESKRLGGFPTRISNDALMLKVPREKLNELLDFVAKKGWVVDKKISREDLHRTTMDLAGRIRSKQVVLDKLREFFSSADAVATIDIERKMTQLVQSIEMLKGQLRVAQERARYGVLTIRFEYRRKTNVVYKQSPFSWINSVNLDNFLREF